ncbi:putative transposase family protein [Haloferax mediterranei ATCC 33500]|uniref:Transposase n=1 Tax=Haloferax mediterranei (strain ATCC 33500 / DSM 1411 / JCM 8866 / NBRC 14739 / NCIMB 2177 / R-4) TaxID=523841 RepID=M0IMM5_HALMT|nr:transposase [Haloferax mediterranei ATCC 33500]ELZ97302.1 putative transposase family protein [Haloferax mediterranei ATCC 33500]
MGVFQTLSNLNGNYLIPKRNTSSKRDVLKRMDDDDQEVAVGPASVHVEAGSHPM